MALRAGLVALVVLGALSWGCETRETGPSDDEEETSVPDVSPPDDTAMDSGGEEVSEPDVEEETTEPDAALEVTEPPDVAEEDEFELDTSPRLVVNGTPVRFGHIIDGDTLDVFVGETQVKVHTVRLLGLQAPECIKESVQTAMFGRRNQCVRDDDFYGLASWEAVVAYLEGKEGYVTCDDVGEGELCPTDDFGRPLVYIDVDGRDLATEMAFQGHALAFTSFFASKRADICQAEYDAQDAGRGMWGSGSVGDVISRMDSQAGWYFAHHDERCDEALGR